MALSDSEKDHIVDMLDSMSSSKARAIVKSESSFSSWLKRSAKWLWDKIGAGVIGTLIGWLFGIFG